MTRGCTASVTYRLEAGYIKLWLMHTVGIYLETDAISSYGTWQQAKNQLTALLTAATDTDKTSLKGQTNATDSNNTQYVDEDNWQHYLTAATKIFTMTKALKLTYMYDSSCGINRPDWATTTHVARQPCHCCRKIKRHSTKTPTKSTSRLTGQTRTATTHSSVQTQTTQRTCTQPRRSRTAQIIPCPTASPRLSANITSASWDGTSKYHHKRGSMTCSYTLFELNRRCVLRKTWKPNRPRKYHTLIITAYIVR